MTQPDLFREEALEYQFRPPEPSGVLRITPPWTGWMYLSVLALVAAGVAVSLLAHIDRTATGRVLLDRQQRTFVALVPAADPSAVRTDTLVRLEMDDSAGPALAGRVRRVQPATEPSARAAGFAAFDQRSVLVTGELESAGSDVSSLPPLPRIQGQAVVVVGSEPALLFALRQILGQGSGQ